MKKIYIIAVVAAALCGILLYSFLSEYEQQEQQAVEQNIETENVVVANTNIEAYTEITKDMVTVKTVTKGGANTNVAHSLDEVVGKITTSSIITDEQIITLKLASKDSSGGALSYQIADGMRAMTINADVVSGVAGYIEEGDLVDVLAITEAESAESADTIKVNGKTKTVKNTITYTAVKNVKVLKLGDITTEKGTVYSTVTLQLSPKQCFRLFTAENNGTLRICLRQKGDTGDINLGPYNYEDLIK